MKNKQKRLKRPCGICHEREGFWWDHICEECRGGKKSSLGKNNPFLAVFNVLLGLIPFIVIGLIIWMIWNIDSGSYKSDCVIGVDSPDCLEGGGTGHPLWR